MKRLTYTLILPLLTMLFMSSCTQNGGHIGAIFGRWHLVSIEADNMEAPELTDDIYWAFQSDVVQMQMTRDHHEVSQIFGVFTLDDEILTLRFPEERYKPFAQTGLSRDNRLEVLKLTYSEMRLLYRPSEEATLTYYLKKW